MKKELKKEELLNKAQSHYEKKEYETAFELFMQAAKAGDKYAQYKIAVMYKNGLGVEQDSQKAKE